MVRNYEATCSDCGKLFKCSKRQKFALVRICDRSVCSYEKAYQKTDRGKESNRKTSRTWWKNNYKHKKKKEKQC